jgi:hypothetical protein
MILDELNSPAQPAADWPPLDRTLLGEARPPPPNFPLHLLTSRWRGWVEASSQAFGSADYLAHCLLGGVAAVCGAGIRIEVAAHWHEPLLLWQALVGGPSSGKSAAFARVRALLAAVEPLEGSNDDAAPAVLVDAGLDPLVTALSSSSRGVLLWREDLVDWMDEADGRVRGLVSGRMTGWGRGRGTAARPAWLAAWNAGPALIGERSRDCLAIGIAGALSPDRLASFTDGDSALASRFLYTWPERGACVSLADTEADDAGLVALLQKIAALAGHRDTPCIVPFDDGAARRLEALMPAIQQRAEEAEGVAAEWIGRGVATVVRLAGVLALMEWAETSEESGAEWLPVGATHIDSAHELWSGYYLPQALSVFDRAGVRRGEQDARRVVRWLRRVRAPQISREEVRREALCQSVDAEEAEEVLARLEAGGVLRPMPATGSSKGGPRRRRWEVHPELRRPSSVAVGAVSAGALPTSPSHRFAMGPSLSPRDDAGGEVS